MKAQAPIARTARACGLLLTAALAAPGARHGGAHARDGPAVLLARAADRARGRRIHPRGRRRACRSPSSGAHGNNVVTAKDPLKADAAGGINGSLPRRPGVRQRPARDRDHDGERPGADRADRPSGRRRTASRQRSSPCPRSTCSSSRGSSATSTRAPMTTFRVMGWEPYRTVYAHYFLNGKRIKTVEIGSVSGPCGDMTKKVRQFPFRPVPAGRYRIRFTGTHLLRPPGLLDRLPRRGGPQGQGRSLARPHSHRRSHSCSLPWRAARALAAPRGRPRARRAAGRDGSGLARPQRLHGLRLEPHRLAVQRRHLRLAAGRREPDAADVPPRRRRAAGVVGRRPAAGVQDRAVRQQPTGGHQRRRHGRDAADADVPLQRRAARLVARRHEAALPAHARRTRSCRTPTPGCSTSPRAQPTRRSRSPSPCCCAPATSATRPTRPTGRRSPSAATSTSPSPRATRRST